VRRTSGRTTSKGTAGGGGGGGGAGQGAPPALSTRSRKSTASVDLSKVILSRRSMGALFNPKTPGYFQKRRPYTGDLFRATSGDNRNLFLHYGDVLGQIPAGPKAETSNCISHQAASHRGGEIHAICAVPELMLKSIMLSLLVCGRRAVRWQQPCICCTACERLAPVQLTSCPPSCTADKW